MADEIAFNEGKDLTNEGGYPASITMALSTKKVGTGQTGEHLATDTYAGGFGEVSYWTGGGRISKTRGTSQDGIIAIPETQWNTGAHADGPASVRSVVFLDAGTSTLLGAINLIEGGTAYDMSAEDTLLTLTDTQVFVQNVGGD